MRCKFPDIVQGSPPCLTLQVAEEGDDGSQLRIDVGLFFGPDEPEQWERPVSIRIAPWSYDRSVEGKGWETYADLTRDEARLLRDFLTSILLSPDPARKGL